MVTQWLADLVVWWTGLYEADLVVWWTGLYEADLVVWWTGLYEADLPLCGVPACMKQTYHCVVYRPV